MDATQRECVCAACVLCLCLPELKFATTALLPPSRPQDLYDGLTTIGELPLLQSHL